MTHRIEARSGLELPSSTAFESMVSGERKKRRSPFAAQAEKLAGFAGLYVIGPRWWPKAAVPHGYDSWPVKIGVTSNPRSVVSACRQWNHLKIDLTALYWTNSVELARRLKKELELALKKNSAHRHGGWFDRDPDMIEMELRHIAEQHRIELFDETQRQGKVDDLIARKVGHVSTAPVTGKPKRMH